MATVQNFLAKDPDVYPEGSVTGFFGPATQRAVKRFQEKHGIEPVGFVGPATRAKLNELMGTPASTAPVPTPTAGDDVATLKALQDQLKALQDQLKSIR